MICSLDVWQKQRMLQSSLIIQASTTNGCDGHTPCSIGAWYHFANNSNTYYNKHEHQNLVLCAFSPNTDNNRRGDKGRIKYIDNLKQNGITNIQLDIKTYYETLGTYKFVVSPEGNGVDCHRHYEALIYGCIPIVEENPLIRAKYGNVPILWTKDYSEITPVYLEQKYAEMLQKTWDFSALLIDTWPAVEKNNIKKRGNFWMKKLTGKLWYTR
jgi:hypothetical protein